MHRLDKTLTAADASTGLSFSVYIGELGPPANINAVVLLDRLGPDGRRSVVVAVSPEQRLVEIATGTDAKRYVTDRTCGLAVASMVTSFAHADFAGGLVAGVNLMREQASRA